MIRVLTGPNTFAWQHELRGLVKAFVAEHGELALERVDGEEASYERLAEAVQSLPFLASKKLVVLRAPSAQKRFAESAAELLADVPETNQIIIVEPKLDKRSAYYKFLKKHADVTEYAQPDANGMAAWLQRQAKDRGGAVSSKDARWLIERVGENQQLLSNELDKLLAYDPQISRANIELLTEPTPQSTIFELLESAFAGRSQQVLALYSEQRALKVEPQQIIAMLTWQLHVLALIKTAGQRSIDEIATESKVSPYVLRKSQGIARGLSLAKLNSLVADLLEIDVKSKSSALDIDEALQTYLLELTISS